MRSARATQLDGRTILARSLSERSVQQQFLDLALGLRWRTYHTYDSRRSVAGWPDLVLVKPPHVLYFEVKRQVERATPEQLAWLEALRACGYIAAVVRPLDLDLVQAALQDPKSVVVAFNEIGEPVLAKRKVA